MHIHEHIGVNLYKCISMFTYVCPYAYVYTYIYFNLNCKMYRIHEFNVMCLVCRILAIIIILVECMVSYG